MKAVKGYLVSIGGAEDKGEKKPEDQESNDLDFLSEGVLKEIQVLLPSDKKVVEVITTASSVPDESFENYRKAFKKLDVTAHHLKVSSREEAEDKNVAKRLERCGGVMISGGDQARLSSIIGGTLLQDALQDCYQNSHFVVAGTSAGAACMSELMMGESTSNKGNIKGELRLSVGLGFVGNMIIDTHFDTRVRFARLAEAIVHQPGVLGIGLGEDTGVIVEHGSKLRAIGSDSITVLDGSNIFYDNIAEIKEGHPISIAKLDVYLMARFDQFDLNTRNFTPAPSPGKIEK